MSFFIRLASGKKILRNKRLINCLILIALVCAPVVAAISFSESMIDGIANKYVYLAGGHIIVYDDYDCNGIENCLEEYQKVCYSSILLCSDSGNVPLELKGVSKTFFNGKRLDYIETEGDSASFLDGIVISRKTSKELSLEIGDKVAAIIVSDKNGSAHPVMTKITGIYSTGYNELDTSICFASVERVVEESGNSIITELIVNDSYSNTLRSVQNEIDAPSTTWMAVNSAMYSNFVNSKQLIMIVMLVVVVMSAFYCSSVAQQFIQDDMEELSLYRILGADCRTISKICFLSVFSVTVSGIIIGFALGCLITYLFVPLLKFLDSLSLDLFSYYLLDFTIHIPFITVSAVLCSMMMISAVAIRLSLRKARRITPLQFFRQ